MLKLVDNDILTGLAPLRRDVVWAVDFETTALHPQFGEVRTVQFCDGLNTAFFDLWDLGLDLSMFQYVFTDWDLEFVAFNAVFEMLWLREAGIHVLVHDARLAAGILSKERRGLSLEDVLRRELGVVIDKSYQKFDWSKSGELPAGAVAYAKADVEHLHVLWGSLEQQLRDLQLYKGYEYFYRAQSAVVEMEHNGLPIDESRYRRTLLEYEDKKKEAEKTLRSFDPTVANWQSGTQVDAWLRKRWPNQAFRKWDRTPTKKLSLKKKDLPTFRAAVSKDGRFDDLVYWIDIYADFADVKGNLQLLKQWESHIIEGRVYGHFLMFGAHTGRFSSQRPNLQNIPRDARDMFRCADGRRIVVADYGQIETRVAYELSGDEAMGSAFKEGRDLHRAMAAVMAQKPEEEVEDEERTLAKRGTFGIMYGSGAAGLAAAHRISIHLAERILFAWRKTYSTYASWRDEDAKSSFRRGHIVSPLGRRIRSPDYLSSGITQLYNNVIQGGAADVMIVALATLPSYLHHTGAKVCATVHDEIFVECGEGIADEVAECLRQCMHEAYFTVFWDSDLPREDHTLVEPGIGDSWKTAKP